MIERILAHEYYASLQDFPVTGIIGLGPRQVGKTTLVRQRAGQNNMLYLDLERTSDLNKLSDPELFLTQHADKMEDLKLEKPHIITPGSDTYPIARNIEMINLLHFLEYAVGV